MCYLCFFYEYVIFAAYLAKCLQNGQWSMTLKMDF